MRNIKEIPASDVKSLVDKGVEVYGDSLLYTVKKRNGEYYIKCSSNGSIVGLGPEGRYNSRKFHILE